MNQSNTTNQIREILEGAGAKCVSRRAVAMVATRTESVAGTNYWELNYSTETIETAAKACKHLRGEESYTAFKKDLMTT